MTFATDVIKEAIGRVTLVDISTDGFSTISKRYADKAGLDEGSTGRQALIVSLSPVRRGFGQQHIATGGTCELVLNNAAGELDWICGRDNISTAMKARFRIYEALYDTGTIAGSPSSYTSKLLGDFKLTEPPRRNSTTVRLQLGDDILAIQGAPLPTLKDWQAVGTSSNNPVKDFLPLPEVLGDGDVPVQLAFGEDWVLAMPHIPMHLRIVDAAYHNHVIVPVCCTTDLGAVDQDIISNIRVEWLAYDEANAGRSNNLELGPRKMDVPRIISPGPLQADETVWFVEKSPTITKDGVDFQIVYLVVRTHLGRLIFSASGSGNFDTSILGQFAHLGGYPGDAISGTDPDYWVTASRVLRWYVKGTPLSAISQQTSPTQHSADVIYDLVTSYSKNPPAVDTTSRARVKAANPQAACFGVVQPWFDWANNPSTAGVPPSLRQTISAICQSADIDVFINWDGEIAFSTMFFDYTAFTSIGSLTHFPETQINDIEEWIPSGGDRGALFNRLYFAGSKGLPADDQPIPFQGPFDFFLGPVGVAVEDRVLELVLQQGWRPYRQQARSPWFLRQISAAARTKISFTTNIRGLLLDLGDLFTLTWTRSETLGGPYADTIFQVESMLFAPDSGVVQIEGAWRDDLQTDKPYLLDEETLLVRSKGALSGSCTENATPEVFDFGGTINLTSMGVDVGDILILREASEAADSFLYNRTYRIAQVNSTTQIEVHTAHTETGHVTANAEWRIERGATTYHTAVTDPTNYPDGGEMYGKITDSSGDYSDATDGNLLLTG